MFITLQGAKIYATAFGPTTAPALLALSGWIGSWEDWAETFSILSENWRTIGYDHRGSGATLAPVETITFPQLVDDVIAVLDAYGVEQCVLAGLRNDYAQTRDGFVDACVPEKDSDHIRHWGHQILGRASQAAAVALYEMAGTIDVRDDLGRITLPTLILHGDADALVPIESARWLADTLPNARLVSLSGAGHVPMMTRPREVAREINSFYFGGAKG